MVPEIAAFCITQEHTATTEDFAKGMPFQAVQKPPPLTRCSAAKKYCHEQSSQGVRIATGDHYTKTLDCNADRCLTFSLFFKCQDHNNATTHGVMPRHACTEYFRLPWASGEMCVSGGYVGSSVPGACWSALSRGSH